MKTLSERVGRALACVAAMLAMAPAALGGCSSSSSAKSGAANDCHATPLACPEGQTCWPVTASFGFACVQSNPNAGFLASCTDTLGQASCGDGMTCDANDSSGKGACTYFCDAVHTCPAGYDCRATNVGGPQGPTIQLCRLANETLGDGGASGDDDGPSGPPPGYLDDGGFALPEGGTDAGVPHQ
jgi:hypothetical protein